MKHITLTFCVLFFVTFCFSQQKLASLSQNDIVKINGQQYHIDKLKGGATIENASNRFIDTKPSYPNLPHNVGYMSLFNKVNKQLINICAKYISSAELLELIRLKETGLLIKIRVDSNGSILEVGFFTGKNSILSVKQLQEIEKAIKKEVRIVPNEHSKEFLRGTNFALLDPLIFFSDILKAKEK